MKNVKTFDNFINEYNNASMSVSGLQCDCGWQDMSVPFEDYEKSIGRPCPDCGKSLLTQEEYDQVLQMTQAVDMINMYSPEDLDKIAANLSEEEIDNALDIMNQLKIKIKDING